MGNLNLPIHLKHIWDSFSCVESENQKISSDILRCEVSISQEARMTKSQGVTNTKFL